jgi:hypothetical protein
MHKYIFLSKNTKINNTLKDFKFIFNDSTSKKVFDEINKDKKIQSFILNKKFKNSDDLFFIGDKDVYMIYVLPKLLELNIQNIFVYNEKIFPEKLEIVEKNIYKIYNNFQIEQKESFIITKKLVQKIKYGGIFAKKINDADIKTVFIEIDCKNIYEIAGAIKNFNSNIKIVLLGKTSIPKRMLMTNPVDFLLTEKTNTSRLIEAVKQNNFEKVKGLYYYDENLTLKHNK